MAQATSSSEKFSFLLVTFAYGDLAALTYARFTDHKIDYAGFTSEPSMSVELPENSGSLDEKEARIIMPLSNITSPMSDNLPHSPVFVKVEEITRGLHIGDAGSSKVMFAGRVMRTIRNFQGRRDAVAFFARTVKARLKVPMGLPCNHHCAWALFSRGCGLSQATHEKFGQIAVIDGKQVTITTPNTNITAPTAPGGTNTRFWERGWLEKDGVVISVHAWEISTPDLFVLRRRPPSNWLLAGASSIRFVPGCHKTIEDCRNVWDNEQGQGGEGGFMGLGYGMLPYNPLYQSPS